jgi:Fe-S oxidoreductase
VHLGEPEELQLSRWVLPGRVPPRHPDFHLLRAYQVLDTCILCGECERTCPANIPLKALQDFVRSFPPEQVFELVPGAGKEVQQAITGFVQNQEATAKG